MELSRRGFLSSLFAAAAVPLINEAIPLGRVWSFPQKIRLANVAETKAISTGNRLLTTDEMSEYCRKAIENIAKEIDVSALMAYGSTTVNLAPLPEYLNSNCT